MHNTESPDLHAPIRAASPLAQSGGATPKTLREFASAFDAVVALADQLEQLASDLDQEAHRGAPQPPAESRNPNCGSSPAPPASTPSPCPDFADDFGQLLQALPLRGVLDQAAGSRHMSRRCKTMLSRIVCNGCQLQLGGDAVRGHVQCLGPGVDLVRAVGTCPACRTMSAAAYRLYADGSVLVPSRLTGGGRWRRVDPEQLAKPAWRQLLHHVVKGWMARA